MLQQPVLDRRGLVGGVVVQDQVQVQVLRDGGVDELEEPQELLVAVPAVVLGDDRAAGQVVGREQARGAVPDVVVRAPLGCGGQDRQAWGGPVQLLERAERVELLQNLHRRCQFRRREDVMGAPPAGVTGDQSRGCAGPPGRPAPRRAGGDPAAPARSAWVTAARLLVYTRCSFRAAGLTHTAAISTHSRASSSPSTPCATASATPPATPACAAPQVSAACRSSATGALLTNSVSGRTGSPGRRMATKGV